MNICSLQRARAEWDRLATKVEDVKNRNKNNLHRWSTSQGPHHAR